MEQKILKLIGEHVVVQFANGCYGGILTKTGMPDFFRIVAGLEYKTLLLAQVVDVIDNGILATRTNM